MRPPQDVFSLLIWSLSRLGERAPSDAGFERSLTVLQLMEQVGGGEEGRGRRRGRGGRRCGSVGVCFECSLTVLQLVEQVRGAGGGERGGGGRPVWGYGFG